MTPSANPRIRVREATPADVEALVDIHFDAFKDNVMDRLMYPHGVSEDSKRKFGARLFPPKPSQRNDSPESAAQVPENLLYVAEYVSEEGAVDEPGEVVAFAKWQLHRTQQAEAEWKHGFPVTTETFGEGCDLSVVDAFIGEMNRKQRNHAKGEPALCKESDTWAATTSLANPVCRPWYPRLQAGPAAVGGRVGPCEARC